MLEMNNSGSFDNVERFLNRMAKGDIFNTLEAFAKQGVAALESATPFNTGITAASWDYTIKRSRSTYTITWTNSNMAGGVPVAILLQLGHGTGTGGYVQGQDFINPAMRPVFDRLADQAWKAVTSA